MSYNENNDFFSYQGTISRKNYIINMLILISLYVLISLVRFDILEQYVTFKFLFTILIFFVSLFKFVILMSSLSLIYRRIADFSFNKSYTFISNMKKLFVVFFVFPLLYIYCIRVFIGTIPVITPIFDYSMIILIPLGFIFALILSFIKRSK